MIISSERVTDFAMDGIRNVFMGSIYIVCFL